MYLLYFVCYYHYGRPSVLLLVFAALVATVTRCNDNIIFVNVQINQIVQPLRCLKTYRCHVHIFKTSKLAAHRTQKQSILNLHR